MADLLPPNATPLERALASLTARVEAIPIPLDALIDPATCPAELLPWLAWGESVDIWETSWSEATKRQAIAESIVLHRRKGTRWAVETVLARIDALATVLEWHDDAARMIPNTFEIHVPLVTVPGAPGGERAGSAIVDRIIADIGRVKPLREHLTVVQSIALSGGIGVQAAARLVSYTRDDAELAVDVSPAWDLYLQTEDGEPLQAETGAFLDTTP